jgi:hypothetical protein
VPEPVDLIACGQPGQIDLLRAPSKLRPGGALICAVGDAQRQATDDLLARAFSIAPNWVESRGADPALVIAQFSPDAADG